MQHKDQNDEVSDTTDDERSDRAGNKLWSIVNCP